jgi:hypothetical protein
MKKALVLAAVSEAATGAALLIEALEALVKALGSGVMFAIVRSA